MAGGAPKKSFIAERYTATLKWFEDFGLYEYTAWLVLILFVLQGLRDLPTFIQVGAYFVAMLPIALPILLWQLWEHSWIEYVREKKYWQGREYTLLEVRLPEEVTQSPYAMELLIRSMYQTGEIDTPIDAYWKGHVKPFFSLELVSTEGTIKFYIWTWKQFKNFIESQIYAHYPTVQVYEVEDYTLDVPYEGEKGEYDIWGIEQRLQKADVYPIATYVSTENDKRDAKEEFKHDQMLSLIEFFSIMKAGEHAWMQIIIRAHTVCPFSPKVHGHHLKIEEWIAVERASILAQTIDNPEKDKANFSRLSIGQQEAIKAMELKPYKQMFDVGIRMVYMYKKGQDLGKQKVGFPTAMRAFEHGSEGRGLNGLKPYFNIGPFNYPWQDWTGRRKLAKQKELYAAYVARQYFFEPHARKWIALNVEELATIYHFPGQVAHTPGLARMPSKRGDAPSNLPT